MKQFILNSILLLSITFYTTAQNEEAIPEYTSPNLQLFEKGKGELALQNAQTATSESVQAKNLQAEGTARYDLGMMLYKSGDYNEAISELDSSQKIFGSLNNVKLQAEVCYRLGSIYVSLRKDGLALQYYRKAGNLYNAINDQTVVISCMSKVGLIYFRNNKTDIAEKILKQALKTATDSRSEFGIMESSYCLALVYIQYGQIAKSEEYLAISQPIAEKLGNMTFKASLLSVQAQILDANGDAAGAEELMLAVLDLPATGKQKSIDYLNVATFYLQKNIYDRGIYCLEKSYQLADEYSCYDIQNTVSKILYDIYSQTGDCPKTLFYAKKYLETFERAFGNESLQNFELEEIKHDTEVKEAQMKAEQRARDAITEAQIGRLTAIRNGVIIGLLLALIASGSLFYAYRQKRKDNEIIRIEKQKSEELLLNILPEETAEELKQNGKATAKHYDMVSVMFTDFKGFTKVSEVLDAESLVAEIDSCFSEFDKIIGKYGIEKIKTIGDAYMCASGLPSKDPDHAKNIVKAAIEIRNFMTSHAEERRKAGKEFFEIRIGVHTGPVVAGIVGIKKFAYDIWGDTVNTAARMESSGDIGKVNVSGTTWEMIRQDFRGEHRGKIAAKNKGDIDMYFVEEK
jgi:class 3 adenylate cyclase/Tfp pilus assembly protein PilF